MRVFYYFNFERNHDVLQSKSPCFLLNTTINFHKNETETKIENSTHSFRKMNLVHQLIQELQIKSKTVMSWSLREKKECIFCNACFVRGNFFNICVLSHCIAYWIKFRNIYTVPYQKNYFIHFFCLFLKSVYPEGSIFLR